jgi:transposase-like protein
LLDDAAASLNQLAVPRRHQQYVRTSNLVERAFVEERRRTKVIPHLWGETSLVNLVFGVLIRISDRWGKKCFSELEQQQIRSLRMKLKLDEQEVSTPAPSEPLSRRSAASAA